MGLEVGIAFIGGVLSLIAIGVWMIAYAIEKRPVLVRIVTNGDDPPIKVSVDDAIGDDRALRVRVYSASED